MTVREAVERDLAEIRECDEKLADSSIAATALVMADQLDDPGTSATSKSMCAKALREAMDRLRDLTPPKPAGDSIDDLAKQREQRRARASAA